jgi:hypothetical protein
MKKCYLESMSREISYMKYENGRLTRLVTSYAETPSKASYRRKYKGTDGSDKKTRKKT